MNVRVTSAMKSCNLPGCVCGCVGDQGAGGGSGVCERTRDKRNNEQQLTWMYVAVYGVWGGLGR